ncbi:hypothetical protein P691DRAFT_718388 [Macrolepiota fuliginosa MF-IS2]|uniref:C2H2-type domain-containing protein n=1 Tax=Macrolepiota fuliginosa MF-IS2 TaxID=1400762 RepID=A0A9P5XNC2_9AGAR|nr:hypothetical protein P691DRAFT_718388 [Macrolepiota fuliginosa MF-IS2]
MSVSAVVYEATQILGKRRADNSQSFILSSAENEFDGSTENRITMPASSSSKRTPVIINGKMQLNTTKRYQCTSKGCGKAYSKPSRLAEHERSHTGERPFQCETCKKSYLRETHLHAHIRSHLPDSSRPFICDKPGCGKRFWTVQHLKGHIGWHEGAKPFACPESGCSESFAKHHQLRSHIANAHSSPGTKSYRCEHTACTKSFSTNQQLKAHVKTHDERRYTCVHVDCITPPDQAPLYFPTWSALQNHIRNAHPPICLHTSCAGRTFTTQKGLRAHLKLHEQRDIMEALEPSDDEIGCQPSKKRRGGEWGRDWICDFEGCSKDFKSKKALTVHKNVTHLGQRNFKCSYENCPNAYGYKHLLQRHVAKAHGSDDETATEYTDNSLPVSEDEDKEGDSPLDIDAITGYTYMRAARAKVAEGRALQCPFPELQSFTGVGIQPPTAQHKPGCDYVFRRAYDLRRHLRASHGFTAQKESVEFWVAEQKLAWYRE